MIQMQHLTLKLPNSSASACEELAAFLTPGLDSFRLFLALVLLAFLSSALRLPIEQYPATRQITNKIRA